MTRPIAFHEAGHVAAHCYLGTGIGAAHILLPGQETISDSWGYEFSGKGLVEADVLFKTHFQYPDLGAWLATGEETYQQCVERAKREIVCLYAGTVAEARYRHKSLRETWLRGGVGDVETASHVLAFVAPDENERHHLDIECERLTRQFICTSEVWSLVEAVAAVLMRDGTIEFDHPLLVGIEGGQSLSW